MKMGTAWEPPVVEPRPGSQMLALSVPGVYALVSDGDWERVTGLGKGLWTLTWNGGRCWYAKKKVWGPSGATTLYLHRFIMSAPIGMRVDHRNGVSLDCRRENLRLATVGQNNANTQRPNKIGFRGVRATGTGYRARITHNGKMQEGEFRLDARDAALDYDRMALEAFGGFALLNFPEIVGVSQERAAVLDDIPF